MTIRRAFVFGLLAIGTPCSADVKSSDVLTLVRQGDFAGARLTLKQNPNLDARDRHILGLLDIAVGNPRAAEQDFTQEIELAPPPAATGLEEITFPGSPLYESLRKQKASVALGAGKAAALNNRAAARFLQGKLEEAIQDADEAAVVQGDWGTPWANGALILMELNRLPRAEASIRKAIELGERNARTFTTLAEIELRSGRMDRVKDDLDEALQRDPSYPFALLAKARFLRAQGKSRESERSFSQALSNGPIVSVESRFEPAAGEGLGLGGNATESHLKLFHHGLPNNRFGYRLLGQTDRQQVEGRSNGYQQADLGEMAVSGPFGTFWAAYHASSGGRPGATESIVGVTPRPDARFSFRQTNAAWQTRKAMSRAADVSFHVGYRTADVVVKPDSATPSFKPIHDEQWLGETRVDPKHGRRSETSVGFAYSDTMRSREGGSPIEPVEQVLPNGKTSQLTSYVVHRRPLTGPIELVLGGVYGGTTSYLRFQPVAQLGVKVSESRSVRLSVTPRINDAVSNFIPLDILADEPQTNLIDRRLQTTDAFNRNPTLQGTRSRLLDFELGFGPDSEQSGAPETVLFHRRLNNLNTQGADPRLATSLLLTPVGAGEATGIAERIRLDISNRWHVRLWASYQESRSTIDTPTFAAGPYPAQVPMDPGGIPNFPRFQGSLRFDWTNRDWNFGLEVQHIGSRQQAFTVNPGSGNVTYLTTASPATALNLFLNHRAGRNLAFTLGIFNLTKANFYAGYPGSTTGVFGYEYHF